MKCLFFQNIIECRDNLFFDCGLSKRIWREVMHKCSVSPLCFDWDAVVCEDLKDWKGKKLASIVCKLALGATVYNIWKHRNNVMFGNRFNSYLLGD